MANHDLEAIETFKELLVVEGVQGNINLIKIEDLNDKGFYTMGHVIYESNRWPFCGVQWATIIGQVSNI